MKLHKTSGLYKASKVTFNPVTCEAESYNWWTFVRKMQNQVVAREEKRQERNAKARMKRRALNEIEATSHV